ncbi:MAG: glycosyltransferase family 2 protein [Acidobacteriota bacterium]
MRKRLSIVIPVYYNADSLPLLYEHLCLVEEQLDRLEMDLQLIFVDDGSGDDSLEKLLEIKQIRPETRVVKLTRNFGAVHATKCGLQFVTGDCFLPLAADLQDPPELIIEMVERWRAGSKFTICERISRDDPILTVFYAKIFYWLVHHLVIKDYPDGGYDMALMDRSLLPYLINSSKNLYTPLLAYWLGFRPEVIKYHRKKRVHGKSRWTFSKKLNATLDVFLGFSIKPIRLISFFGVVVACLSFLYGNSLVVTSLMGNRPVPGFATIASLLCFLLGIVIVMLGVIAEYLLRVFEELNKRPEVVIDEIY